LKSITGIKEYLDTVFGGTNTGDPVALPVAIDLADGTNWEDLLSAIDDAVKYVALDLSACTMSGTEFDPDNTNSQGKDKIVSLVLPDAATSIESGYYHPTFRYFTSLESVNGAGVETVGQNAFNACTTLKTVDLPVAETIGGQAFKGCTGLETVSLPNATSFGAYAFASCYALTTVDLPAATDIGYQAFGETALETVYLPVAETIGDEAFIDCSTLATVYLPAAETIGQYAFYGCYALTEATLPEATIIGKKAFGWCTALTTLDLSAATNIGEQAFVSNSGTALTITLGDPAPTLGVNLFASVFAAKSVTVRVPFGSVGSYDSTWQTNFCGGNGNITLNITTY
jgi:hypothetical protein